LPQVYQQCDHCQQGTCLVIASENGQEISHGNGINTLDGIESTCIRIASNAAKAEPRSSGERNDKNGEKSCVVLVEIAAQSGIRKAKSELVICSFPALILLRRSLVRDECCQAAH
jgi:hypothetical protein